MPEPVLGGIPLTTLFLYFIAYSFLGWCVETTYCCVIERRWVARGFLYGPICPIYGAGALLMILFFTPLIDDLALFYATATVVMSAWEYFVGWLLETTTHIKYWDYSDKRFNLKGRVCLQISLCWGLLSYVTIFLIHPHVAGWFDRIPFWLRYTLSGSVTTLLAVDVITTIRSLAMTARLMTRLEAAAQELKVQTALARSELEDRLEAAGDRLEDALRDNERLRALRQRQDDLLDLAEAQTRRFRSRYSHMSSPRFAQALQDISERGARVRARLQALRKEPRSKKR